MTYPPPPGPPSYGQQPYPPPKKSNSALWITLAILAGIIVVCGGLATALGGGSDDSADATATRRAPVSTTSPASVHFNPGTSASGTAVAPRTSTSAFSESQVADMSFMFAIDQQKIRYSSRASIITLAHTVCEARDKGNSATGIALEIAKQGFSPQDAGYIVGAAQSAYCPRHK